MDPSDILLVDPAQIRQDINKRLEEFFAAQILRSQQLNADYGDLWRVTDALSKSGGKRVRPYLLTLAYQAFGGGRPEQVLDAALAQELLHLSLLVHDDIIDKDYVRYGQLNVAGSMRDKYRAQSQHPNSEHYANGAAILAGDLLISGSYQVIVASTLTSAQKITALEQLGDAIFMVGGGELLDTESVLHTFQETDPIKIAELKTARYSFVTPLVTGALLAGASSEDAAILTKFGTALGVAYQLADDLLGVFGDEKLTGKTTIGDIREGKRTYLMKRAFERADKIQTQVLESSLGNPDLTVEQAVATRTVLKECGAYADTLDQVQLHAEQSLELVAALNISDSAKQAFRSLIKKATERSQ